MNAGTTTEKKDIFQRVTDTIVKAIEEGAGSYRMPWRTSGGFSNSPINAVSKRPYRGINILVLWAAAQAPMANASREIGPRYPAFVDKAMVARVAGQVARYLELCPPDERPASDDYMQNMAIEAGVFGLRAHRSIAERLAPVLRDMGA